MGIYLDRIKNLSIEPINITADFEDDVFSQITEKANQETNGYIGIAILTTIWISLYGYILTKEDLFKLTKTQALLSVSTVTFTIAVYFIWTGILTNVQHYVWFSLLFFLSYILIVLRY